MESNVRDDPHYGATEIRASKGGGGKWLLGALAAVVLVGGAYAAWNATQTTQNEDQYAINNEYADEYASDDGLRASPLGQPASSDDANDSAIAEPASAAAPEPRARSRSSGLDATTPPTAVPETTIGVTPINATSDETVDESESVIVTPPRGPVWARVPTARRLAALYPARALEREREGEARLACVVQESGRLACQNVEQTPGFGGAALRVANTLQHEPYLADGSSAAGTPVNLRVVFRMEDEPQRWAAR
jgi:TonB family protein